MNLRIILMVNFLFTLFFPKIHRWCDEAGGNITVKTLEKGEKEKITPVDDTNPFWIAFKNATDES